MDRRSWLWRKKSSEKSPGAETESTGSSHSERFLDDQAYPTHSTQSSELNPKAASNNEDANDIVKTLKENLSAALLDVSTKEDLVKQHANVAEEAVAGWEKAENEVSILKNKLESSNQKSFALEERLSHLEQALKECVRQLRQAREEQEQKTREWEFLKSILDDQVVKLQVELRSTKESLEAAENENSTLKSELRSRAKEIEIGILERDLSVKAAESASKQHLESKRKVSKLEAECQRLNALARKSSQTTNQKPTATSVSDSQLSRSEKKINLMDDFLEMERLVASPDQSICHEKAELEIKLEDLRIRLLESEMQLGELRNRLFLASEAKRGSDEQVEAARRKSESVESKLRVVEDEVILLLGKVGLLEKEVEKERASLIESLVLCQKLEDELLSLKLEMENQKEAELEQIERTKLNCKYMQENELALAAEKFAECQKTIASLGQQLKSLANLEDFLTESPSEAEQNSSKYTRLNLHDIDSEFRDRGGEQRVKSSSSSLSFESETA